MDSDVSFAVKLMVSGRDLSHAFADELEAMSVVDETIENRICERGIADCLMPVFYGDLTGYDC
jgi:hypothetical protein